MTLAITYTVSELAEMVHGKIKGNKDQLISNVASLKNAKSGDLTFITSTKYRKLLQKTQASVVILNKSHVDDCPSTALIVESPELAFAKIARLFEKTFKPKAGIHPTAVIAEDCNIDPTAAIGIHCVIQAGTVIGANTVIMAGSVIGENCEIGADCVMYSNVTFYPRVIIGNRVTIHSGTVIGSDGFGNALHNGCWEKIPQLGRVVIEDDVEIGANCAIDRGALEDTIIRRGAKLDNLIQIAHNVQIGEHTAIAGAAAIAGSAKIGKHCLIGGAACVNGHVTFADGVILTGMAMATKSLHEPGIYSSGTSIQANKKWLRSVNRFHRLDEMAKRLKELERHCDECDGQS